MLDTHILPTFGRHRLNEITRNDVKAFATHLRHHLSPASVRSIVTLLGLLLREAIDEHHLHFDPTARLRLRDGPSEPRPTATATARQVNATTARMPHRQARSLIITAAYTGMRFGELAALTRANLHLDQAHIHVSGTTGALHEVGGKRGLGPPKPRPPCSPPCTTAGSTPAATGNGRPFNTGVTVRAKLLPETEEHR